MAFEQGGGSFTGLIKASAIVKAGTGVFIASDGTYTAGAAVDALTKLDGGNIAGVLAQDVTPTAGTLAGAKSMSILTPNGDVRKCLAASTYTPAIGDMVMFDSTGFLKLYAHGSGIRGWGYVVIAGVASGLCSVQLMPTIPTTTFNA